MTDIPCFASAISRNTDPQEAANEIASTEQRLHDMVGQLRNYAGVAA